MFPITWAKSKERLTALWHNDIVDRCCLAVTAPRDGGWSQNEPFPENPKEQEDYWLDEEQVLKRYLRRFEHTCYLGEAFPQVILNLGPAGHAGFFKGCQVSYSQRTVWFQAFIHSWEQDQIVFDAQSLLYRKTMQLARYFVQESGGRYFVSMPDIAGNLDALAHMRGTENLMMDLELNEQQVRRGLDLIQETWHGVNGTVYDIVKDNNDGGLTIGWLGSWAPGFHAQMNCDLSVMISPKHFATFVAPELVEQARILDFALYHLDGAEQLRHLDALLSIENLDMIQWTCVAGQPAPLHYVPALKRIQAAGKGLLIKIEAAWLEPLLTELSSRGLFLVTEADSPGEAEDLLKLAIRLTHD
jgi:hypothetical protein